MADVMVDFGLPRARLMLTSGEYVEFFIVADEFRQADFHRGWIQVGNTRLHSLNSRFDADIVSWLANSVLCNFTDDQIKSSIKLLRDRF